MPADEVLDKARVEIYSHKQLFRDFLTEHGLTADKESIMPFTQWITPPNQPKCVCPPIYRNCGTNAIT